MYANYQAEVFADFHEVYHESFIDLLEKHGGGYVGDLCSQLPASSRVRIAQNPDAEFTKLDMYMTSIEYNLRLLVWLQTRDAQHGKNKPKPLPYPGSEKNTDKDKLDCTVVTYDTMRAHLEKKNGR